MRLHGVVLNQLSIGTILPYNNNINYKCNFGFEILEMVSVTSANVVTPRNLVEVQGRFGEK
jgi:hypothetical protein